MTFDHKSIVMHTRIHIHIHTHTSTHLHKDFPTIYYSYHFVIFNYHKSYQQYFDNSLNYKKLEKLIAAKRRKINNLQ